MGELGTTLVAILALEATFVAWLALRTRASRGTAGRLIADAERLGARRS